MPDASPAKWHLAHTSWFFETFVLGPHAPGYVPRDARYAYLFNSYYVQAGERHCRAQRGLVTRPTVAEVYAYRAHVDAAMHALLDEDAMAAHDARAGELRALVTLGLHHEQQHQELLVTDLKHLFWTNPLRPTLPPTGPGPQARRPRRRTARTAGWRSGAACSTSGIRPPRRWRTTARTPASPSTTRAASSHLPRAVRRGRAPRHEREYLAFVADGAYTRPTLWLSAGWDAVAGEGWEAPLYWERDGDGWSVFTLHGRQPLDPDAPVCHLSYYEADAFARWAGARLPTEAEWEVAAAALARPTGHSAELDALQPVPSTVAVDPGQWFGDVWQWTASPYVPYPGFRPAVGAVGEYNGKFMCDQWVLRGASVATPGSHARSPTATSSPRPRAGSSPGCARARRERRRPAPMRRAR
jgi:ergothioneine biosynthesis protein EgtB